MAPGTDHSPRVCTAEERAASARPPCRCCKCNGEFDPEPRSPACLPTAHGVPPAVLGNYDEFWVCTRCEAVYWQGGQYGLAVSRLADVMSSCQLR